MNFKRIGFALSMAGMLTACSGDDDRRPNSVFVPGNNSSANSDQGNNTSTTNNANNTTPTNNTTTNNANNTTPTNNTTTNNTQGGLALSGNIVAGDMPPQLPIACAVRLYDPNDVNQNDPDLFAVPAHQFPMTVSEFPMAWTAGDLNRNETYYVGVLCDRDDDQSFDNIGGWHVDEQDVPTTVTVPADALLIAIGTISL